MPAGSIEMTSSTWFVVGKKSIRSIEGGQMRNHFVELLERILLSILLGIMQYIYDGAFWQKQLKAFIC